MDARGQFPETVSRAMPPKSAPLERVLKIARNARPFKSV